MKKKSHARSPDKQGFSVALPITLVRAIEDIARRESRSRNGQIEYFLHQAVLAWQFQSAGSPATGQLQVAEPSATYPTKPKQQTKP